MSTGSTGSETGYAPILSEEPITCPPRIPPPAINTDWHDPQWSLPPSLLIFGVRPNSPITTINVWSNQTALFQIAKQGRQPSIHHRQQLVL